VEETRRISGFRCQKALLEGIHLTKLFVHLPGFKGIRRVSGVPPSSARSHRSEHKRSYARRRSKGRGQDVRSY
jgi:hypothetical protein